MLDMSACSSFRDFPAPPASGSSLRALHATPNADLIVVRATSPVRMSGCEPTRQSAGAVMKGQLRVESSQQLAAQRMTAFGAERKLTLEIDCFRFCPRP